MPISQADWDLFHDGLLSITTDKQIDFTRTDVVLQELQANWDKLHDFLSLQTSNKDEEIARLRTEQTANLTARTEIEDKLRRLGQTP